MPECGHKNRKDANFCCYCGIPLKVKAEKKNKEPEPSALETPFGKVDKHLLTELELLDATEVIQIVRRPDENLEVDVGELDADTAISLMAKGMVQFVIGELMELIEVDDDDDED